MKVSNSLCRFLVSSPEAQGSKPCSDMVHDCGKNSPHIWHWIVLLSVMPRMSLINPAPQVPAIVKCLAVVEVSRNRHPKNSVSAMG